MAHTFLFLKRFLFWGGRCAKIFWGTLLWLWLFGFILFEWHVSRLEPSFSSALEIVPADAIVVFTGSSGRVQTGIQLLKQNYAPRLLISGVESQRQVVLTQEEHLLPITLGYQAKNTVENVKEAADWLTFHRAQSAYLVTADYHMPRSSLLLRSSLPRVQFFLYPLKTSWSKRLSYSFLEYHKYMASWFFYVLGGEVSC